MNTRRVTWWALGALAVVTAAGGGYAAFQVAHVEAADHLDPPARTNPMNDPPGMDRNADIADIYAWHTMGATGRLTTVLMFSGPNDPGAAQEVACDRDVLYQIHIDNDGDIATGPEFNIDVRFGHDDVGNCFVRLANVPNAAGAIVARVEEVTQVGEVQVYAGLRDDPFFFDLEGFRTTLMTGTLGFRNDVDFFAGKNTSAIVLELPIADALAGGDALRIWATTGRAS